LLIYLIQVVQVDCTAHEQLNQAIEICRNAGGWVVLVGNMSVAQRSPVQLKVAGKEGERRQRLPAEVRVVGVLEKEGAPVTV
jgi:hypothetical protein